MNKTISPRSKKDPDNASHRLSFSTQSNDSTIKAHVNTRASNASANTPDSTIHRTESASNWKSSYRSLGTMEPRRICSRCSCRYQVKLLPNDFCCVHHAHHAHRFFTCSAMRKRGLPCPKLVRWSTVSCVSSITVRLNQANIRSSRVLLAFA